MENNANFTHKELCLLLETICKEELGVYLAKNVKDLRKKVDVFAVNDNINIQRKQNKQGKTRVSVFITSYIDEGGRITKAYTPTI